MKESAKIIHKVAKELLGPEGFVQLGSSRKYAKDYGYFLILVTYIPIPYCEGSFLDVFASFYFDYGFEDTALSNDYDDDDEIQNKIRKCEAIYDSSQPEAFEKSIREITMIALDAIKSYSRFVDIGYACRRYSEHSKPEIFWYFYSFGLLLLLDGKYDEGINNLYKALEELKAKKVDIPIFKVMERKIELNLREKYTSRIHAQEEVVNMVNDIRSKFAKENRFKRMKLGIPFSLPGQNTQ